jgi:hypothetical protein
MVGIVKWAMVIYVDSPKPVRLSKNVVTTAQRAAGGVEVEVCATKVDTLEPARPGYSSLTDGRTKVGWSTRRMAERLDSACATMA